MLADFLKERQTIGNPTADTIQGFDVDLVNSVSANLSHHA
jgi:hypothetical protein